MLPEEITLSTLHKATEQEVFEKVFKHIYKQGKQSSIYNKQGRHYECMYRGKNGLMCAAGCLISDEEYQDGINNTLDNKGYEGTRFGSVAVIFNKNINNKNYKDIPLGMIILIDNLQKTHDNPLNEKLSKKEFRAKMVQAYKEIARRFGLQFDPQKLIAEIKETKPKVG